MGVVDQGFSGTALFFAGSATVPIYLAIGSGSGIVTTASSGLVAERLSSPRTSFTTRDISTYKNVVWTFDYTSTTMSGTLLTEFGLATGSVISTADLWSREGFASITFDGTNELQVDLTFNIF